MIEVVSAVIIRNGRILLTQRREDKDYPFMWECPGGKVDDMNESHHDALRRELLEELGLNVMISPGNQALWCAEVVTDLFLLMYRVVPLDNSVPKPLEGQGIGWFDAEEMQKLTLTPGNKAALHTLVGVMHQTRLRPKEAQPAKKCECGQPAREGSSFCSKQCREGSEHST